MNNNAPTANDLADMMRQRICQIGQAAFAREAGASEAHISLVCNGKQRIGPKIAKALGYRRVVRWEPLQTNNESA